MTKLDNYSKLRRQNGRGGAGGNGVVSIYTNTLTGETCAIKILNSKEELKNKRFQNEVRAMLDLKGTIGVIPVIDYCLEENWYAMPVADKIEDHIKSIDDAVECVTQISETLVQIHEKEYSHRDIKPANILFYEGRFCLCDFGLVDIPDSTLTKETDRIGALRTIAPEMSRLSNAADCKKADVYSLAKTLWILLSGNKDCFDGKYSILDDTLNLNKLQKLEKVHLVEIHKLLEISTDNDPKVRPTMEQFHKALVQWADVKKDWDLRQRSSWNYIPQLLFHSPYPSRSVWTNCDDIRAILNVLSKLPMFGYLYFSDGGSLNYQFVEKGREEGTIDLIAFNTRYRIKPKRLFFEDFKLNSWNYFLLETEEEEDSTLLGTEQYLVEDYPGHYVSAKDAIYGVYDYDTGEKLPEGYQIVHRYKGGKFLIVLQGGPYCKINEHDDGRHGNCTADELRDYVGKLSIYNYLFSKIDDEEKQKEIQSSFWNVINDCKFQVNRSRIDEEELETSHEEYPERDHVANFVENNWMKFDFSESISIQSSQSVESNACYYFIFNLGKAIDFWESFSLIRKELFLARNGRLSESDSDILYIDNLISAKEIHSALIEKIHELTCVYCHSYETPYFRVEIKLKHQPSHLFTEEEIKDLMRNADDREANTLVVTPDGFVEIIQDRNQITYYPVYYETWEKNNLYVGKYSKLSTAHDAYLYCIGKWREYLRTGIKPYMDDYNPYETEDESQIVREIEELMKIKD